MSCQLSVRGWNSATSATPTTPAAVPSERLGRTGQARYRHAKTLTITADLGGSNSSRGRLWKTEVQQLADRLGIAVRVLHFPPATSQWNRIEHRLFSFISHNWRGKPLTDYTTIINLIASTTTTSGLKVYARLDHPTYEKAIQVTDAKIAKVNIDCDTFRGDWNCTIHPTATLVHS